MAHKQRTRRPLHRRPQPPARESPIHVSLIAFLCAVFLVKVLAARELGQLPLLQQDAGLDTSAHLQLARRVLEGHLLLGPGLYYLSPVYTYFLALLLAIRDSLTFVRIVQAALGTAAVWCVFLTAREWFGERAAWIAGLLAAFTGEFTFYEVVILQSALDTVLSASALLCLTYIFTRADSPRADRFALACGALFGLQILNRPNIGIAFAGIAVLLLVTRRVRQTVLLVAAGAIVLSSVVIRNIAVSHQFALLTSQGGLNFYIGNHEGATGQYVDVPGIRSDIEGLSEDTRRAAGQALGHDVTDSEASQYFTDLALSWMRAHPTDAVRLFVKKLALVFNHQHQWLDYSYPYYAHDIDSVLRALIVGPWLLVPLGLAGFVAVPRARPRADYLLWAAYIPLYAVAVAVFFVGERHRLPLLVALTVTSGAAVDALIALAVARPLQTARAAGIGVAALLGIALTSWPFHLDDGRFAERLRLSKVLMNRGDFDAAARELLAAHDLRPGDTATEFNLGMALVSDRRPEEGLPYVRHAVDSHVPIAGARYALVRATEAAGDQSGAVRLLRTYRPAEQDDADSCFHVALMAMDLDAPDVAVRYLHRALELRPDWPEAKSLLAQALKR